MSGMGYLLTTQWKNRLKAIFQKPSSCICALLMIFLFGFVVWTGNMGALDASSFRPMEEVYALCTALYLIIFVMTAYNGLSRGASLYTLADVNYLFSAPIHPKRVLFYGLLQQLGASLMIGYFLLFQYSWLRQVYGIDFGFLLLILLGYSAAIFLGQLTAMALYSCVSGNEKRRRAFKTALFLLCGAEAAWLISQALPDSANWAARLSQAAGKWPVILFPVGGWMGQMVRWFDSGNMLGFACLAGGVLYAALLTAYLGRAQADFYENVLDATQRGYMTAAAKKEGKLQETLPDHIKVGKTGLGGGFGASAFYFKHKLESRRARRFLLDTTTLIFLLVNLVFAFFTREAGLAAALAFATYMQLFSIGTGRWARELLMPHIYLTPERPYKKLIWLMRESLEGYFLEALLLFVPVGLMLRLTPWEIAAAVACRVSFAMLFMAGNMVTERLFGGVSLKMLVLMFYILVMLVLAAPGVALAILLPAAGLTALSPVFTWVMALTVLNALVSLLCLFLCRNILTYAELNQR